MKKHIERVIFSCIVLILTALVVYQYELSKKEEVRYADLHKLSQEILDESKVSSANVGLILIDLQKCEKHGDTLKTALIDAETKNANLYKLSKEYLDRLAAYDKSHKSLWDQYLALQADYNAYMDFVNSGEEMKKIIASIEACAADNDSIKHNYNKLAITYTQLYEYSDSIYAYSNGVYRDYHRLDSAYNILFDEYEVLYNEYLNDGAEVVSNE
jgi:hypothetical protein